ncbi:hypothetical protein ACHAWF_002886 [Thalassiosira exigua]
MMTILTSYTLSLAAADKMADAAIVAAYTDFRGPKAVCITVLDSAGGVIVHKRMDGCPDGAYAKFSLAKARTCVQLMASSREFREKYTGSGEAAKFTQAAGMVTITGGDLCPVAGGVLIKAEDGSTIGAIGVSGAAADEDEYIALKGAQAVTIEHNLTTMPENHSCKTLK